MRKLFLVLLISTLPVISLAQKQKVGVTYDAIINRVIDGDTVVVQANFLPDPLKKELSVRIFGVDTPEKGHRAQCPREAALGQRATEYTTRAVTSASRVTVMLREWDKYGGRVIGDIMVDGTSLRTRLIREGLAREYFGEAKTSWCN